MKMKVLLAMCLMLVFALLKAEDDSMYGAFKIVTSPKGADVNLYDLDLYLCDTPSPVYPVFMDEFMELREGIPGREITLMITKKGYVPLKKDIFVPFNYTDSSDALDNPSVFKFELERDYKRLHWQVTMFYMSRYRYPRPHHHNNLHYRPWCPPLTWHHHNHPDGGWYNPHHPGGGNNHHNPPGSGGGGHHNPPGGGGFNPPVPPDTGAIFSTSPDFPVATGSSSKPYQKTRIKPEIPESPAPEIAPEKPVVQKEKPTIQKEKPAVQKEKPVIEKEKPKQTKPAPDKTTEKLEKPNKTDDSYNKTDAKQEEPVNKKKAKTKSTTK
ncbi:MAG: hypothetical protein RBS43_04480 [Candidatus Cloacimonas sp.]|nr:hypothetical protein [Candidatus Cloacimonas sp.]